ncbi:MAG: pitrilysin family protein [Syntrophobacteraceae bacterium]
MVRKTIALSLLFGLLLTSVRAYGAVGTASELARECQPLSADLQTAVQRVMYSKPGDLFVVLKNGLTVLVRQSTVSDIVSAQVFVRAGSIFEGKYLTAGLSHYLEHVLAGGSTRSFTEAEARERLQRLGGATNAYTTYDRTVFYINSSADHWKDALDLLMSYVSENTLNPSEVAREKAVIQQEIKMGENSLDRELWKLFIKTAYQVHPVRFPVVGYEEVFVNQSREALADYYSQRYQPENMVVVLAGNVVPSEAIRFLADKTKNFSRRANEPALYPSEPVQVTQRWEEREFPLARLVQAKIGFPSARIQDRDLYALDVLALLLGEGQTCPLYCRLKDRENKVLGIGASNWTPSFVQGQFIISVSLPPQNWPGVLTSIREEIDRFKQELVSPEDLEKAKKTAAAQHVFSRQSISGQASSLGSSYLDTGDPYFDEAYVDAIRRVTPEEILDVARRYLVMERSNVAVVRPPASKETQSPESTASALPADTPVERHQLKNGLKTLIKRDATLPLVTINLYGAGGLYLEDTRKPGLSAFTSSLLMSGTRNRGKMDIARAIENIGGVMGASSDNNSYHVSVKVLKEDFDLALDILGDIVQNASFPDEEIAKQRTEALLLIQRSDESWQAEIARLFKKNYFKKSSYGNDRLGTKESVESISRDDIVGFYRRMVSPGHSVLAVYGDVDVTRTREIVEKKFGSWTGQGAVSTATLQEETRPLAADATVEKKNEKTSSALFIGTNGLALDSSDRVVLDVLDAVLSGGSHPGGRLFEALRGKDDLVYVVSAFPFYGVKAGYFGVITQTTMGKLDRVQNTILENLRKLVIEPVPADELETAKNVILTSHQLGRESLDAQAQSDALNEVLGLGWDYDRKYAELIRGVDAASVQRLAKELFSKTLIVRTLPENPVEIMAQPPAKATVHTP